MPVYIFEQKPTFLALFSVTVFCFQVFYVLGNTAMFLFVVKNQGLLPVVLPGHLTTVALECLRLQCPKKEQEQLISLTCGVCFIWASKSLSTKTCLALVATLPGFFHRSFSESIHPKDFQGSSGLITLWPSVVPRSPTEGKFKTQFVPIFQSGYLDVALTPLDGVISWLCWDSGSFLRVLTDLLWKEI